MEISCQMEEKERKAKRKIESIKNYDICGKY